MKFSFDIRKGLSHDAGPFAQLAKCGIVGMMAMYLQMTKFKNHLKTKE